MKYGVGEARTEENRRKISTGVRRAWVHGCYSEGNSYKPEVNQQRSKKLLGHPGDRLGKPYTEEMKAKQRATKRATGCFGGKAIGTPTPREIREKIRLGNLDKNKGKSHPGYKPTPEECRRRSEASTRAYWSKSEEERNAFVARVVRAIRRKPTNPEKRLIEILTELSLPYAYVGNGKLVINGLNPDFANVNGQKKLIELFGVHWHSRGDEITRGSRFAELGYSTLFVWETELKDLASLKEKLLNFEGVSSRREVDSLVRVRRMEVKYV